VKGITSQNATQTSTGPGLRTLLGGPTIPASTTTMRPPTPIAFRRATIHCQPGILIVLSGASSCQRGLGHRSVSRTKLVINTVATPARKNDKGPGRSLSPPRVCAAAGRGRETIARRPQPANMIRPGVLRRRDVRGRWLGIAQATSRDAKVVRSKRAFPKSSRVIACYQPTLWGSCI
jgi:hypothetical protein